MVGGNRRGALRTEREISASVTTSADHELADRPAASARWEEARTMTGSSPPESDEPFRRAAGQPSDREDGPTPPIAPRTDHDERGATSDAAGRGRAGPGRPGAGRWRRSGDDGDGALRGLLDGGRSKISLSSAMRARDVARPTADDQADAERVIADRIAADRARAARPPARRTPGVRAPAMWKRPPRPAPPTAPTGDPDPA
jgi:hypothetical protein